MNLSLPRSINFGAVVAAIAYTSLTFGVAVAPAPATAAGNQVFYKAQLSKPVENATTTVAGGVVWSCKGDTCIAAKGSSRPMRVCRELQKEHGESAGFTAKGEALASDKLAKCNG